MEAKISLLEKLPDSMLTNIPPDKQPAGNMPANGLPGDESAAIQGAAHTKIENISLAGSNPAQPGQISPLTGNSVAFGDLVESKLAVDIMDSFIPSLFVVMLHWLNVSVKKSELQLTEKEKNTLSPIMKKCLDTLLINFSNPWATLGIALLFMYGSKVTEKGLVKWLDALKDKPDIKPETKMAAVSDIKEGVNVTSNAVPNQSVASTPISTEAPQPLKMKVVTEEAIEQYKKANKCNRDKAIAALKARYKKEYDKAKEKLK